MDNSEHPRIGTPRARRVLMSPGEWMDLADPIEALEGLGVWTYDPATRDVRLSEGALRLLRIPPSEIARPASFFFGMVHPDDRGIVLRWFLRCTRIPSPAELTFRVLGAPGERQTLAGRGVLRRDPATGRLEAAGTIRDVTAQRELEASLRAAVAEEMTARENARAQVLFEKAKDGVFVIDHDLSMIDANESIARMLGTTVAALKGTHPWDWDVTLPTREAFQARWPEALPEEGTVETTLRRTDGSTFEAEITFNRVRWGDTDLVYVVCRDITERKRYRSELEAYRDRLRALAASLRSSREDERAAVARELHDDLGQLFTALKLDVTLLEHAVMPELPPARQPLFVRHIVGIMRTIDAGMRTLRGIVLQLRPEVLDTLGLTGALEWSGTEFTRRTAVPCWLQAAEPPFTVPQEHATALYRMYQEILTNITRHAHATTVKAVLTFSRDAMHFVVEDDGRGFEVDRAIAPDSLGILGMRERAAALSGSVAVESRPGTGTTVRIILPLQATPR